MPRIGERGWVHSGVKVYDNTAAPTSWTDLDLSAIVGKTRALVFFKTKNRHATNSEWFYFRSNGENDDVGNATGAACAISMAVLAAGRIIHYVMETDTKGIIEWKTTGGYHTDLWVLGYIR